MADFNLGPLDSIYETTTDYLKDILDNQYVYTSLFVFLTIYGSIAAPKLPEEITSFFEMPLVQVAMFFLIGYIASKNISIAIITAVALAITLQTQTVHRVRNTLMGIMTGKIESEEIQPVPQVVDVQDVQEVKDVVVDSMPDDLNNGVIQEQSEMEQSFAELNEEDIVGANDVSMRNFSTIVSDSMGLMNDSETYDYMMMGYDKECPGKFDRDIVNPNNQFLYEDVYPDNHISK
jgi:hypothetical protein